MVAADDEEIGGAVERRQPLVGHGADQMHARGERRRLLDSRAHVAQQIVAAVDHRQRRLRQPTNRALECVEHRQRILVRIQPRDPEHRRRAVDAARRSRVAALHRSKAGARLHHLIRRLPRSHEPCTPPAIDVLAGREEERVDGAARDRAHETLHGRAPHRSRVGVVLHDDRRGRRQRAAQTPRARGEGEAVDMRDVGCRLDDGSAHVTSDEHIVDAVAPEARGAMKPLHDARAARAGVDKRLAPAGERRVAREQRVGVG